MKRPCSAPGSLERCEGHDVCGYCEAAAKTLESLARWLTIRYVMPDTTGEADDAIAEARRRARALRKGAGR